MSTRYGTQFLTTLFKGILLVLFSCFNVDAVCHFDSIETDQYILLEDGTNLLGEGYLGKLYLESPKPPALDVCSTCNDYTSLVTLLSTEDLDAGDMVCIGSNVTSDVVISSGDSGESGSPVIFEFDAQSVMTGHLSLQASYIIVRRLHKK